MYSTEKLGKIAQKAVSMLMAVSIFTMSAEFAVIDISAESVSSSPYFTLSNVKADEGEYNAFVRLGKEFYESSIEGKYSSCSGAITQESVYAYEYALNKDILSEKTIERLVKNKIIDLPTYAETVNSFCAAMMEQVYIQRETNSTAAPDFDDLTLNGYDFFNCRTASEYLARYAVLDKNALWEGDHSQNETGDYWECVNDDRQLVFGWVKRSDGSIVLQTGDWSSNVTTNMHDDENYYIVLSNDRYYFLLHGILQDNVVINFKDYDDSAEDRDISIPLDSSFGISMADFETTVGAANAKILNESDSVKGYIIGRYDYSLPVERTDEYRQQTVLAYKGASEISVDALSSYKLDVSVVGDSTGYYNDSIYFTSSDPSVADVDYRGNVYGISEGDAVITAVAKTSGICSPLQVKVHVNNSPEMPRSVNIGYVPEDINYDVYNRSICFDALTDKAFADGASSVMISDMPVFCLDGSIDFSTDDVPNGELTLEHKSSLDFFDLTIKYSDYKALADMAHQKGIKVYAYIMPEWRDGGLWDGGQVNTYFDQYVNDPTDENAKLFVDKYFNAYESYWLEVAPKLDAAGIDGIYLNYEHNYELNVADGHWSSLISKVRNVYDGELLSMTNITWNNQSDSFIGNSDLFENIDRIGVNYDLVLDTASLAPNPSYEASKQIFENSIPFYDLDRLYEKYGKPMDVKTGFSSTAKPSCGYGTPAGKGKHYSSWDLDEITSADYLQQMITWQAFCDVLSSKGYINTIYSKYNTNDIRSDYGCDFRSGYDCGTTVYEKPASKLLERHSVKSPLNDALKQADAALALAGDKYASSAVEQLKNAITSGYAAETAEDITAAAADINAKAAEVCRITAKESAAALSAARTELRNTIAGIPSADGYSAKSYAVLTSAVQSANELLADTNSQFSDILLAKSDIEAAIAALVEMPAYVENVRAIPGDTIVTVKWNKVEDADGYRVLYNGTGIDVGDVDSYLIKGLTNGQFYSFAVQYIESGNYSASSPEVTVAPEELVPVRLNVKPDESEYSAFVRLGKEFYENYIMGKYPDEDGSIINQNSVYAFEYALNKDILSDSTINKLVLNGYIDLPTYAETVNSFCAEMIQATDDQRVQNGVTAPDFDKLTLYGCDLYRSRSASQYLFRHAILDKNALWEADFTEDNYNVCRNSKGDLVVGWVKSPNGTILLQSPGGSQDVVVHRFWINDKYQFVQSNDRIYFLDADGVLQKDSVTVNFADYVPENVSWWEELLVQPEDRDIVIPLDENCSISMEDFEKLIGKNFPYFIQGETFHVWYVLFYYDFSLPRERTDEYNKRIELSYDGDETVFLDCLTSAKLNVTVKDDADGWYSKNMFFTSSDPSVAEVDNLGNVYGISEGDAVITAVTRTSGICNPVRVKVHVNNSPKVTRPLNIGYELEDCLYDSLSRGIYFDSLAERVGRDGGDNILICDQPSFYLNGNSEFSDDDVLSGELTLKQSGATVIPIEDYRRLAEEAHKNGTKLYIGLQPWWSGSNINSQDGYAPVMLKRYAADPTDADAAKFTDQFFNAMKNYWVETAPKLEAAGVDGIFIHNWQSFEECVMDDHWTELISAVREVYHGELLAMVSTDASRYDIYRNNGYIFNNVDKIAVYFDAFADCSNGFTEKNPSLDECKRIFTETRFDHFQNNQTMLEYLQMFYDLYHKPIDLKLNISATDQPTSFIYNYAGKDKFLTQYGSYDENNIATVDYLQQMITLQALLEVISEVDYIEDFSTNYYYSNLPRPDIGYDTASGYDCSATVFDKPAAQLLSRWSKKAPINDAVKKANEALALAGDKYAVSEVAQLKSAIEAGYAAESYEDIVTAAEDINAKSAAVRQKVKQETSAGVETARKALQERVEKLLPEEFYTDEMNEVLSPAVQTANALLADENATYSELIQAAADIDDAENTLVKMVEEADIQYVIDFVNKFTAAGEKEIFLTPVQLRAIEIVLEYDYNMN